MGSQHLLDCGACIGNIEVGPDAQDLAGLRYQEAPGLGQDKPIARQRVDEESPLQSRLEETLVSLEGNPKAIVLVTDLEALHPYIRIGAIEAQLQSKFHIPTVFLYPGIRTGKTHLKFLGFYPEDGNYRSVHVGG